MFKHIMAVVVTGVLAGGVADSSCASPPPSQGHDSNHAAPADPKPNAPTSAPARPIRFRVYTTIEVVVTYNAGHGNKFIDSLTHDDSWNANGKVGETAYVSATPFHRGAQGRITVVIDYGTDKHLICHDTNFDKLTAGANCSGRIR